jgi:membrane protein YqaA with SNARE-associated domain
MLRRLYDWVLSWSERPAGAWALAALSFAESSFFPIPPDVLLIALAMGKPKKSLWFAAVCSVASIMGGMFGYLLGYAFWTAISGLFFSYVPGFTEAKFAHIQSLYETWNFWIVFTAGFTPIPYKIFTVSAGVFAVNFPLFLIASAISRSARFFIVAGLIYFYGPSIQTFIDRYFNLLAIAVTVLLVGGFTIIKVAF